MPSDPLKTFEGINVGDVLIVAKKLTDKKTGEPYWWKTFRVVTGVVGQREVHALILRMQINPDTDERWLMVDQVDEVITLLPPAEMPQGVRAMLMKYLTLRRDVDPF